MTEPVPFQPQCLDHVVLRARDSGRLIEFYQSVLGCMVERDAPGLGLTQLRAGACLIDIVAADSQLGRQGGGPPAAGGGHNMDHLCLRVEPFDPDAIHAHLEQHGAAGSAVRHVYGAEGFGPSIYVDDPEGNTVELKGPADGQP